MLIKILVVDDSASDRLIIKKMLSDYTVLTANDGVEALRMLDEDKEINLMILDLNMPNMNGFQVLAALKKSGRDKNLRTIILTNYDELDNEINGLKQGAVDYIRKPINMNSLKARIDVHIELIHSQNLLEQKLSEKDMTFDTIFNQAPIGIVIFYSDEPLGFGKYTLTSMNSNFEEIVGRTKEQLILLGLEKITHPDDLEKDMINFKKLQSGEMKRFSVEKRFIKPDGEIVWVRMIVAPLTLNNGHRYNYILLVRDITKRILFEKALIESERSKSVLLSNLPGLAYRCDYDRNWTMKFVSDGCFKLTGYLPESFINNRDLSFNDIISPEYREILWLEWSHNLTSKLPFKFEYEITTSSGEKKWVIEVGQGIYKDNGDVEALEGIILDISDRKAMENNLRYLNEHDSMTGLYNRDYLEALLEYDAKYKCDTKRALININLSTVHLLTANYGFHYTQNLIKKVAETLNSLCKDKCMLFKTYENRFVCYFTDYEEKNDLLKYSQIISDSLISLINMERISAGIGILEIDQYKKENIDLILKRLLAASEKAIGAFGKDIGLCFCDKDFEALVDRESDVRHELARIAEDNTNHELFLHFQPIFDLKSNTIDGFEALARLHTEKLGSVPPIEFIPIAEKTKLIIPIGEKIILEAFAFENRLRQLGYESMNIAINVSATQLLRPEFTPWLLNLIEEMNVNPNNIGIEITESVIAQDYAIINEIIGKLKRVGLQISIDDFGTGYSSLAREKELNVDCLKIDKTFIDKLQERDTGREITGDIISMAHKLGHYTIAEGVEYEVQKQYLVDHGCDKIQGYLISRPVSADAAIELLKKIN